MIVSKTLSDEVTIQDCFQSVDWHWPIDTGNRCRGFTADDGTVFNHNRRIYRTALNRVDRDGRRYISYRFWCQACDDVKGTAPE